MSFETEANLRQLFSQTLLSILPHSTTLLPKGVHVYRARHGKQNKWLDIWDPARNNVELNRANLAGKPVFYGSIGTGDYNPIGTVCMEMSKQMRHSETSRMTLTVGVWRVVFPIDIYVIHRNLLDQENPIREQARKDIEKLLLTLPKAELNNVIRLQKRLDHEFQKVVLYGNNYEYLFSAVFSDIVLQNYPGIAYSSVETSQLGQNIALLPSAVRNNLEPTGAYVLTFDREGVSKFSVNQVHHYAGNAASFDWG